MSCGTKAKKINREEFLCERWQPGAGSIMGAGSGREMGSESNEAEKCE